MTPMSGEFLDTNILVYAFTGDPRNRRARDLLERGCVIGVQVLNEFANVARRKLDMSWDETCDALDAMRDLCTNIVPLSLELHDAALVVASRHDLHVYDALIVAAALQAQCETLWSEEMHDGLVIDGRLRIANPFQG
jgi:predicted nucleic acid-binding protein